LGTQYPFSCAFSAKTDHRKTIPQAAPQGERPLNSSDISCGVWVPSTVIPILSPARQREPDDFFGAFKTRMFEWI